MWTYAALKAALAALAPAPDSLEAKAEAINAQAGQQTVDVPARDVRGVLYARGKLPAVSRKAIDARLGTDSSDPAFAALHLVEMWGEGATIPMTIPAIAAQCEADLALLVGAEIITEDDKAAALSLATRTRPIWDPPVTAGDVQTAEAQP